MSAQETTILTRGESDPTEMERLMALLEQLPFWPPRQCEHGQLLGLGQCRDCDEERCAAPWPMSESTRRRKLLKLARHYAAEWPLTDVGRLARAYLEQLDEAGVP